MMIEYYLFNPTENITALVMPSVAVNEQPALAGKIMNIEPTCEQVGFVNILSDHVELRMAGGEFCGNATMSAAALWGELKGLESGAVQAIVSGTDKPVRVEFDRLNIRETSDGPVCYNCRVTMPEPVSVRKLLLEYVGRNYHITAVDFAGILHLVTEDKFDACVAEEAVKYWCSQFDAAAIGLMQLDGNHLTPLVYVPGADTLFWEKSCASGTTAAGVYLARKTGRDIKQEFIQPGGSLTISVESSNRIILTGNVSIFKNIHIDN